MRKGLTLLEVLITIGIIALILGLLLPAIQQIRQAALLVQSKNNLRQICLGLNNIASDNTGRLPASTYSTPPYRFETFVELLPYIEQENLYIGYVNDQFSISINAIYQQQVYTYINPLDPSFFSRNSSMPKNISLDRLSVSCYALNGQFFYKDPRMNRITDGLSQTIWLTEHYGWNCNNTTFIYPFGAIYPWSPFQIATFAQGGSVGARPSPGDYYPITSGNPPVSFAADDKTFQILPSVQDCDPRLPNASSSSGLQIALADGSVRVLSPSTSPRIFWGMVTFNRGEVISFE